MVPNWQFRPSLILSETYYPFQGQHGAIGEALARVAAEGFFKAVEIMPIASAAERRRIAELVGTNGLSLTCWLTALCMSQRNSLSNIDETLRGAAVATLRTQMKHAVECGATVIGVAAGPDPGPQWRVAATKQLRISLCELCEAAAAFPNMRVVIEPLDRGAHKNGLIGPTSEAVELVSRIREKYANIGICWDSAHAALNCEDLCASLTSTSHLVTQMHLSNAILDRASDQFGDNHMLPGKPGFLTTHRIAELLGAAARCGLFEDERFSVAVEVRTAQDGDPDAVVRACQWALTAGKEALERQDGSL